MSDPTEEKHAEKAQPAPRVNWSEDDIRDVLRNVVDPELHMNIVDLGLVYKAEQQDALINVDMTLTSPGCPFGPYILHQVKENLLTMQGVTDATVQVVWEPMWTPEKMTEEARLELGFDV